MNHLFWLIAAINNCTVCLGFFFSTQCRFVKIWRVDLPVFSVSVFTQLHLGTVTRQRCTHRVADTCCRVSAECFSPLSRPTISSFPSLSHSHIIWPGNYTQSLLLSTDCIKRQQGTAVALAQCEFQPTNSLIINFFDPLVITQAWVVELLCACSGSSFISPRYKRLYICLWYPWAVI